MADTDNTPEPIWQINPKIRFRRMFDEAVVVHIEQAEAVVLNEPGISFLELCDGHRSVQQIIDIMLQQYDIEAEVLRQDIPQFALQLYESGIIVPVPFD